MNPNLVLGQIFDSYKTEFSHNIKEAHNTLKNCRAFDSSENLLTLETYFNELIYLTSYETYGKMNDLIHNSDLENKTNFIKLKSIVPKLSRTLKKVLETCKNLTNTIKPTQASPKGLKDQIEMYRLTNVISLLEKTISVIPEYLSWMDIAKALLAFEYQKEFSYNLDSLTMIKMNEYLEKMETKRSKNIETEDLKKNDIMDEAKRFNRVRKIEKKKEQIDFDMIAIFCGSQSSNHTLSSKEEYTAQVNKFIKAHFNQLTRKTFILPKFYFKLRTYTLNRIRSEITEKQILYLINTDGEKIYPFVFIEEQMNNFFDKTVPRTHLSSNDYKEQEKKIEDGITFEIANIENKVSKYLKKNTQEEKKNLILRYFEPETVELYRFLLPPQKTIDQIIMDYLRS